MKHILAGASALALFASAASAAGLDRSGQSILPVFNADGTVALSFGMVNPNVNGTDIGGSGGSYDDVGETYTLLSSAWTNSINDQISYSLMLDQPYGANVSYDTDPTASNLGGTSADLSSQAVTLVGRYAISDRFSVFAGVSVQRITAEVALNGTAYAGAISTSGVARAFNSALPSGAPQLSSAQLGAALTAARAGDLAPAAAIDARYGAGTFATLGTNVTNSVTAFNANNGYDFDMEATTAANYLIGAAYEIPDIALRFAATYRFETEHTADTSESVAGRSATGEVEFVTPRSLNLDFQTGIAPGTLLTASYRWTEFSEVDIVPTLLGSDLVNLEDGERYTIGLGRQFNEKFAGSVTYIWEPTGSGDTVSPLGPTDGLRGLSLAGRYQGDGMVISGGINYSLPGDADAGVADRAVAAFEDNSSFGFGLRAEFTF